MNAWRQTPQICAGRPHSLNTWIAYLFHFPCATSKQVICKLGNHNDSLRILWRFWSGAKVGGDLVRLTKPPCYARYTTDSSERPAIHTHQKLTQKTTPPPPQSCHQFAREVCHLRIKMKANMTIALFFSLSPASNCPCECDGKSKMLE